MEKNSKMRTVHFEQSAVICLDLTPGGGLVTEKTLDRRVQRTRRLLHKP